MDRRFLLSYTDPAPFRLLGKTMFPWCLKYRVCLTALNSPLITGETVGPEDLLLAVNVCSESTIGKFGLLDKWRLLRLASKPEAFKKHLKYFSDYTMVSHWPKFWEKKTTGASASRNIPWCLSVVVNLVSNGIPEERAWLMPECQAIWMNTAFAVAKGADLNVLSTEEEEMLEAIEKAEAAKKVANPAKVEPENNG